MFKSGLLNEPQQPVSAMHPGAQSRDDATLAMVGVNYRTAPLAIRECLSVNTPDIPAMLREIMRDPAIAEAMILSTCNRVELYAVVHSGVDWYALLASHLTRRAADGAELASCLDCYSGDGVARHFFRVAAGLESMVLGEAEIIAQIKKAATAARAEQTIGTVLHRLIDSGLAASKLARTRVRYDECGLSVAAVAVKTCKRIFTNLRDITVMVLGAGETAELTLHYLVSKGVRNVFIANRTLARAEQLAQLTNGAALHLSQFPAHLKQTDVVISCTSSPTPILTVPLLRPVLDERTGKPLLVIDLAVPRDVEPAVADLAGVQLLNIDHLMGTASDLSTRRLEKFTMAEEIVEDETRRFSRWLLMRRAVPTIVELQRRAESRRGEVADALVRELAITDDAARQLIDRYTKQLVGEILRDPTDAIKQLPCAEDAEYRLQLARQLFAITPIAGGTQTCEEDPNDTDAAGRPAEITREHMGVHA